MTSGNRAKLVKSIIETDTTFERLEVRGAWAWVGRCIFCQAKLVVPERGDVPPNVTIEHIVPRNHGGTDAPENLALACGSCNGEKGRRHDNREHNDARRVEVVEALLERRRARWPEGRPMGPPLSQPESERGPASGGAVKVSRLFVYPVKSMAGVEVSSCEVVETGFLHDRELMLVDERGRFVSQREHPSMATLVATVDGGLVRVRAPSGDEATATLEGDGARVQVDVWGDACEAIEAGAEVSRLCSDFLSAKVRLVRLPRDGVRLVDTTYARRGERVGFADGFPFLLVSQGSIDAVSEQVEMRVGAERFRPNIVVEGCEPFAEDDWGAVQIGGLRFDVVKPCSRCSIVDVDPSRGVASKGVLAALAGFRKKGQKVYFGQNVLHAGRGVVRVGDEVKIGQEAEHEA